VGRSRAEARNLVGVAGGYPETTPLACGRAGGHPETRPTLSSHWQGGLPSNQRGDRGAWAGWASTSRALSVRSVSREERLHSRVATAAAWVGGHRWAQHRSAARVTPEQRVSVGESITPAVCSRGGTPLTGSASSFRSVKVAWPVNDDLSSVPFQDCSPVTPIHRISQATR